MLPDPSNWAAEAFSNFRGEGLPATDWPLYRDSYIVKMTQVLAEKRSKAFSRKR